MPTQVDLSKSFLELVLNSWAYRGLDRDVLYRAVVRHLLRLRRHNQFLRRLAEGKPY